MRAVVHGIAKSQTWLRDWTELNWTELSDFQTLLHIKKLLGNFFKNPNSHPMKVSVTCSIMPDFLRPHGL